MRKWPVNPLLVGVALAHGKLVDSIRPSPAVPASWVRVIESAPSPWRWRGRVILRFSRISFNRP